MDRLPPALAHVRSLEGGPYYTRNEVCKRLGISRNFLLRRIEGDEIVIPKTTIQSTRHIALYTADDIVAIRRYLEHRKRVYPNYGESGRPQLYTSEQRAERQRTQMRLYYYRRMFQKCWDAGNTAKASHYAELIEDASEALVRMEREVIQARSATDTGE